MSGGEAPGHSCTRRVVLCCLIPCLLTASPLPAQGASGKEDGLLSCRGCMAALSWSRRENWTVCFVMFQLHRWRNEFDVSFSPDSSTGSCYLWTLSFPIFTGIFGNHGQLKPIYSYALFTQNTSFVHIAHLFYYAIRLPKAETLLCAEGLAEHCHRLCIL